MTSRVPVILLAAVLLTAATAESATTARRPLVVTSQDHSLVNADDCQSFNTRTVTSLPSAARAEEKRELKLTASRHLTVKTGNEGGVAVRGWDRPFARLTVCKSAVALTDEQARKALAGIDVSVNDREVIATGPELNATQTWWVNMILWVPRTASLDVTAANGGIAIRDMSGKVTARATNGGISVAGGAGAHHLETSNGGISINEVSGSVQAVSRSGTISLKVRSLSVPALQAETAEQGEIYCKLKDCRSGLGDWAPDRKRLRLGGEAQPSIRLTSYNADIMIEQFH